MNVSVQMDPEDRRWLQDQAKKFGGIITSEFVGQVKRLKNRLIKAIYAGGGLYGIPTFAPRSPITEKLHGPQWGGFIEKKHLVMYWKGRNGAQMIGFPDKHPAALRFGYALQTAYEREFTKEERVQLYHIGFNRKNTPVFSYQRPARPVIKAFAEANYPDLFSETRKKVEKILNNAARVKALNAKIRAKTLKQLARKR